MWIGDAAEIKRLRVRKQKTDRLDAKLLLKLLLEDRFPRIWVPSPENRDGHGQKACSSVVLDVAERLGLFAVGRIRFARGKARNRTWREVKRRPNDWASRSLKREFEVVIMVEVLIGEMFGSD